MPGIQSTPTEVNAGSQERAALSGIHARHTVTPTEVDAGSWAGMTGK